METSAKTAENVDAAFELLTSQLIKQKGDSKGKVSETIKVSGGEGSKSGSKRSCC